MNRKKAVIRTCCSCRRKDNKLCFFRIVRTSDGQAAFDRDHKLSGRGAYLCQKAECLNKAKKSNSIARSLSCQIPEIVWEQIEKEIG